MRGDWWWAAAGALCASGCSGILGLDEFEATSGEGGGGPTSSATSTADGAATSTATTSSAGGGPSSTGVGGQGGAGGGGAPCDDEGATEACYDGDPDLVGVGLCARGERTCEGGAWSACEGQVLPAEEDLATWADESCSPGDAEVLSFVRHAGSNDDYVGGAGWLGGPDDDAVVALGTYGALTVGDVSVATRVDSGMVIFRQRRDGSIVWARGSEVASPAGLATGAGIALVYGFSAAPEKIDDVALPESFVAVVDGDGRFRSVVEETADLALDSTIHGLVGAYGIRFNSRQVRHYTIDLQTLSLTSTTALDFSPHLPRAVTRTPGGAAGYLVVGGVMSGTMSLGACTAQSAASRGFIGVFSGVSEPTCVALETLQGTGSSAVHAIAVLGDVLYVSGTFSGTLIDENDLGVVSEGTSSAFIARMTIAGGQPSLVWLRAYGGSGSVTGGSVVPNPSGGVEWSIQVPVGGHADVDGVTIPPYQGLVSLDAAGEVRFARHLGLRTSAAFMRSGDTLLAAGDLADPSAEPFGLDPTPPPGGLTDAFVAFLAAP